MLSRTGLSICRYASRARVLGASWREGAASLEESPTDVSERVIAIYVIAQSDGDSAFVFIAREYPQTVEIVVARRGPVRVFDHLGRVRPNERAGMPLMIGFYAGECITSSYLFVDFSSIILSGINQARREA